MLLPLPRETEPEHPSGVDRRPVRRGRDQLRARSKGARQLRRAFIPTTITCRASAITTRRFAPGIRCPTTILTRKPSATSTAASGPRLRIRASPIFPSPTPESAQQAQAQRTDIPRGGFGSTSHHTQHLLLMQRHCSTSRPDWRDKVEAVGLTYHSHDEGPYWDESACYELTAAEVDALEAAGQHTALPLHRGRRSGD